MKIAAAVVRVMVLSLLFYLVVSVLEDRYEGSFGPADEYPYARGNASDEVRSEIMAVLDTFQEGYEERDLDRVEPFMDRLFADSDVLVLGTMPREVFVDFDQATRLVRGDWTGWGNCRFAMDQANVSANGNVAWFATVGYVQFDLSRLLVLPLRLTGVLVKESGVWNFRQLQFQFDVDLSYVLAITVLVAVWLAVALLILAVRVVQAVRR